MKVFIIYQSVSGAYIHKILVGETKKTLGKMCKEFKELNSDLDIGNFNSRLITWLKRKYKFKEVKYETTSPQVNGIYHSTCPRD